MQKLFYYLCTIILFVSEAFSSQCFIVKEGDVWIYKEGDCEKRYAPCSTFKVALSLMVFDAKILIDEMHPIWFFEEGYPDYLDEWKQNQNPNSWIKNSCVWYSQILTKQLGIKKFQTVD